jgi:hypothetical protein
MDTNDWFNSETGQYVLDASIVVPDRDTAVDIAIQADQDAIFHLDEFNEIRTKDLEGNPKLPDDDARDLSTILQQADTFDPVQAAQASRLPVDQGLGQSDGQADNAAVDPVLGLGQSVISEVDATDQTTNVRTGAEGDRGLLDPAQDPQSTGQEGPIQLGNQAEVPLGLQASDGTGSSPDLGAAVQPPLKGVAVEAGDTAAITKFRDGLVATNATHKFGFAVEDKGPDFYANPETRLFTSGGAGVAVTPDGDMVSVFKQPGTEGNVRELIDMAIEAGADRLDNYDIGGFLPGFYAKHGFKQVARVKFNREFAPEGTPADQSPDIALMVHDPDGVVQADDTLFEDYEDAAAAQMAAVAQVRAAQAQVQETHTPEFEVAPLPVEITNKKKNTAKTIPYALTQSPESTTFQGVVDDPTLPDYKKKFPYKVTGEGQKRINRQIESGYVDELKRPVNVTPGCVAASVPMTPYLDDTVRRRIQMDLRVGVRLRHLFELLQVLASRKPAHKSCR